MKLSVEIDSITDKNIYEHFISSFKNRNPVTLKVLDKEVGLIFGLEFHEEYRFEGRRKASFNLRDRF